MLPIYLLSPSFGGTFGNFRPLSLTTSTCVNPHRDFYHYFERALSPTCEHYNVNEHPRNPSGYFRPLSFTTSACVNLHILNLPLLRKHAMVNAEMPLQIAFSEMNTLPIFRGYSRQLFTTIVDFFGLR